MNITEAIQWLEKKLPEDLEAMKPLERARFLADLWEWEHPKLQRSTYKVDEIAEDDVNITIN